VLEGEPTIEPPAPPVPFVTGVDVGVPIEAEGGSVVTVVVGPVVVEVATAAVGTDSGGTIASAFRMDGWRVPATTTAEMKTVAVANPRTPML
jgi:hypothetical protein